MQWKPSCFIRRDRQTDVTKLIVAFSNFANAPDTYGTLHILVCSVRRPVVGAELLRCPRRHWWKIDADVLKRRWCEDFHPPKHGYYESSQYRLASSVNRCWLQIWVYDTLCEKALAVPPPLTMLTGTEDLRSLNAVRAKRLFIQKFPQQGKFFGHWFRDLFHGRFHNSEGKGVKNIRLLRLSFYLSDTQP